MEQIQHCNGWPPGRVSSQTPFWWTAVHYHSYFWILCREALLHWTMANVFRFQVWTNIFVGETNTGFPHDCSGFDLLGETGVKKAAGMVLLSGKSGFILFRKHSEDQHRITVVCSDNFGEKWTGTPVDLWELLPISATNVADVREKEQLQSILNSIPSQCRLKDICWTASVVFSTHCVS